MSIASIGYWTASGSLRSNPDGTLGATSLGRVLIADEQVEAWPPAAGWPATLDGSCLEVSLVRAFSTTAHPSVRHAVICATRNFYNGATEIMVRNAVFHLLRPWRRLARTGVSTTRRLPTRAHRGPWRGHSRRLRPGVLLMAVRLKAALQAMLDAAVPGQRDHGDLAAGSPVAVDGPHRQRS